MNGSQFKELSDETSITAGTLFRSTNGCQNWSHLSRGDGSDGLHADTHAIVVSPANPNSVIGGTQDNGTNRFTGQLRWDHIRGGDGGYTLGEVDPLLTADGKESNTVRVNIK